MASRAQTRVAAIAIGDKASIPVPDLIVLVF